MNPNQFNKIISDAMGLFNTFGAFAQKMPEASPDIVRPRLPSFTTPNLNERDIKSTNEYYLEKIKNFLNRQI